MEILKDKSEDSKLKVFQRGVEAAERALVGAIRPLLLMDEAGADESANIEAMGWNSVWAGEANQKLWGVVHKRYSEKRKNFEDGCQCIKNKEIELKGRDVPDMDAVIYYEHTCKCGLIDNILY